MVSVQPDTTRYNPIGNLTWKTGVGEIGYPASGAGSVRPHAATFVGGVQKYWYDANGNMIWRAEGRQGYRQYWNEDNRLTGRCLQPDDVDVSEHAGSIGV